MLRLKINSNLHGQMFLDFETQEQIDQFLLEKGDHYGTLKRTEIIPALEEILDEEGNVIQEAVEEQTIIHPATVEYVIEDITEQVNLQKESEDALKLLNESDYKVLRHLREKALGLETTLTEEEYLELEQERHEAALKVIK